MYRIESLLSARLFLSPQLKGDRICFISNLSGRFSLYAMDFGGSVPEPLLPPGIALQNPELMGGSSFHVVPELGKIIVMLDNDGDEKYVPMSIPIEGGFPERIFPEITDAQIFMGPSEWDDKIVYLAASALNEQITRSYRGNLKTGELTLLFESKWGGFISSSSRDESKVIIAEGYTFGDTVLFIWEQETGKTRKVYGKTLDERSEGEVVPPNGVFSAYFTENEEGLVTVTSLFDDSYGLGYLNLSGSGEIEEVRIEGIRHSGAGELTGFELLKDDMFKVTYNIDGASWAYDGRFVEGERLFKVENVVCGEGVLSNGVMNSSDYDEESDRYVLSFSTASSPTQIYSVGGADRKDIKVHTREHILGIREGLLSDGEDASFTSFDGERVSARLYLPPDELGFEGPRPVVYYIHGGPQGQERPDFAWFSMPLIQYLTLNGLAVFVPNARGSTGYGMRWMKMVDRDWGGNDRLDHVHAMTEVLPKDKRLDASRAGVVGRSYGGYMTLTLAARHPELWSAAVDMFGPYNLFTFIDRLPETWKPYFHLAVGDPEKDEELLTERSPSTYVKDIKCPLLVIQGANDPRVIERESRDVVENLREMGKEVDYLVFENEGHDVIKYENKAHCYERITEFFKAHLGVTSGPRAEE
jgi:pimeloyl-ACP methyl ester carboxylesterase